MEIEFDPNKERLNRKRHHLSLKQAAAIFDFYRIDDVDDREDYRETRYVTLGRISPSEIVVCVWTPRGEKARIISLRRAEPDEREIYNFYRP